MKKVLPSGAVGYTIRFPIVCQICHHFHGPDSGALIRRNADDTDWEVIKETCPQEIMKASMTGLFEETP